MSDFARFLRSMGRFFVWPVAAGFGFAAKPQVERNMNQR